MGWRTALDSALAPLFAEDVVVALESQVENDSRHTEVYRCWNLKSCDDSGTVDAPAAERGNSRILEDHAYTVDVVDVVDAVNTAADVDAVDAVDAGGTADFVDVVDTVDAASAIAAREWVASMTEESVRLLAWAKGHNGIRRQNKVAWVVATSHIHAECMCVGVRTKEEQAGVRAHTLPCAVLSRTLRSPLVPG